MTLMLIICAFCCSLSAPPNSTIPVMRSEQIRPFDRLADAISTVESGNNPLAIGDLHLKQHSYGKFQVRQTRLDDYFKRTGIRYTTQDMFNPDKARQIFFYYASQFSPYELDKIAKSWNGSGPMTEIYWRKVKRLL